MNASIFNLSSLNGSNGFRLDGEDVGDYLGGSVSSAGDVNGDGFDDVIVDASGVYIDRDSHGASYVVFGKASEFDAAIDLSSLDGTDGFRLNGVTNTRGDLYSMMTDLVSNVGDVNGDGFDDILVGAHLTDSNSSFYPHDVGYGYVIFGKASGFDAAMDLSSLDGNNGFSLGRSDTAGIRASSAGDVNGDGFDDFILGAPSSLAYSRHDASYVVFGKASGFDAHMNLSDLDGSNGFRVIGGTPYDGLGSSVSNAGDVNGDGFDDVIVGAPFADSNDNNSGSSYVVFGRDSGFDATLDISSLDGSNGFRLDGVADGDLSGESVSSAGDVNGDGFDDLVISALEADPNGYRSGSNYVVFGKAAGFSAAMNLSSLDGSNGFRLDGAAERDYSGVSVSSAGDVNGDGFGDLIIGALGADPNGDRSGSSYVVFGKASGFSAAMNLSSLDSNSGVRLDGVAYGDSSGGSVSSAGDINNDGFDDLIVGASGADSNGENSGSSYVIFGSRDFGSGGGGELPKIKGTEGDDTLKGSGAAEHFIAGGGNDNLLGRGGADVFDAGTGDDAIRIGDLTFASIDGGEGNDALHLAGSGMNLDLTALGDQIHNIETICLYGRGDNTLTLTADSLLNLSGSTHTLKVNGNSGDHVVVQDSGWIDGGSHGFYHTYTHDDAVLLVGTNVTVEFV